METGVRELLAEGEQAELDEFVVEVNGLVLFEALQDRRVQQQRVQLGYS